MFGPLNTEETARLHALPIIKRARGVRLYGADSSRWIDCWLDGGRALIGHHARGICARMKNEMERGLLAPYPHRWTGRLEKAVSALFPAYPQIRIYSSLQRALEATDLSCLPVDPLDLPAGTPQHTGALWGRPLLLRHPESSVLFPILALPGFGGPQMVLASDNLPASDSVSPVIAAALTRLCADLSKSTLSVANECPQCDKIWKRRGPYMMFRGEPDNYDSLFHALFSRRVLIAPSAGRPSVYPGGLSEGEHALLHV